MGESAETPSLKRWAAAAGLTWFALGAGVLVFSLRPDGQGPDAFGVAGCLLFVVFAAVGAVAGLRGCGKRPAFVFAGLQFTFAVLTAMLALGNAAAALREAKIRTWLDTVPDYAAAYDEPLTVPGIGGYARPNVDMEMKAPKAGRTIRFRTNNLGFGRAGDTTLEKPEGTFRILFPGDSFVMGYRVDTEGTVGNLLEAALNERVAAGEFPGSVRRIEVLSANTENFPATWYYLARHAQGLDPDLVVWNNCLANDFSQSVFQMGVPPVPPGAPFVLSADGVPEFAPEEDWEEMGRVREEWAASDANRYPEAAFEPDATVRDRAYWAPDSAWALGKAVQRALHGFAEGGEYRGWNMAPNRGDRIITSAFEETQLFLKPEHRHPVTSLSFEVAEIAFDGFGEWHRETGIPLMVATIPVRYQVVPQDYEATFGSGPLREELYDMDIPNRFVEDRCAENGLMFFDYTPAFRELGTDAWPMFMPLGDIHWSKDGHALAARAIEPEIVALVLEIAGDAR